MKLVFEMVDGVPYLYRETEKQFKKTQPRRRGRELSLEDLAAECNLSEQGDCYFIAGIKKVSSAKNNTRRKRSDGMTKKGWHFLREDRTLQYGVPPAAVVEVGVTLEIEGEIALCQRGFHASERAIDALVYAPGPIACLVEVGGEIVSDGDKFAGQSRKVLAMADASLVLHEFACWCAENALKTAKVDDKRCWAAIKTKRKWLVGEATDKELSSARASAAWARASAASACARASSSAAWESACAASAAWESARASSSAAWESACAASAAWESARASARDVQNSRLTAQLQGLLNHSA